MKKIISIVICALLILMFTACDKNAGNDLNGYSDSLVVQEVNLAFAERGVKLGMTEEEVLAVETLNFIVKTGPDFALVLRENDIHKTIYSETTTKFGDYDAIVTYKFRNNSLYYMEYSIDVNYSDKEIFSTPAYTVFLDFTLKYTDIFGNPNVSETDNDSSFWISYYNAWYDSKDEICGVGLLANQSTYQQYKDDYSDTIHVFFTGFIDE